MISPAIHRVTRLDLGFRPWRWPFAEERRADIDAHFTSKQLEKPRIWNGRLLLGRNPVFTQDSFAAEYFETDFASFLAWRDWGFPDKSIFNGFGMGALRCSDGLFVLGEMGSHTANAGRVYFPAGTPDLDDIDGTNVDIAGSVSRELEEETGLDGNDYNAAAYWHCVVVGSAIAMMLMLDAHMPGAAMKAKIEINLAKQPAPELSAIHLVRDRNDFTTAMPKYVTAFIEHVTTSQQ